MGMKMKRIVASLVMMMVIQSALATTTTTTKKLRTTAIRPATGFTAFQRPTTPPTPAGLDLTGKMFTLSRDYGAVSFYPPSYQPYSSPSPYTTWWMKEYTNPIPTTTRPRPTTRPRYTTRPRPTTFFTTEPQSRSVSVCLRFITDEQTTIFTLSPTNYALSLTSNGGSFLMYYNYYSVSLSPNIQLWPNTLQDLWTSVCLTVDSGKNVVQLFKGPYMSIRKLLPSQFVWSGEPVVKFSGFGGQVTDIQVWDYPLGYKEVFHYMSKGFYGSYRGSVLTWSFINFSMNGGGLLEESYDKQARGRGLRRRFKRHLYQDKKKELL
ncbi:uncharacterized protein KZ484_010516 [Pholidichthys leucotaenia]